MRILIKKASPKGWKKYKEIRLDALKTNPESFGRAYEEEKGRSESEWKSKLKDKNRVTLLAFEGEEVIGISIIIFESSIKMGHIATLSSVYVKPDYRKKGIANQLISQILKIAKSKKRIVKLTLNVTATQLKAVNLYKKFGFRIVGELQKEMNVNGKYYNSYVMELLLK